MSEAEASVVSMIGERYTGAASAASVASAPVEDAAVSKFNFDAEFQSQLAMHCTRDAQFMRKAGHLIKPEYFENVGEAGLVNIALRFWQTHGQLPNRVAAQQMLRDDLRSRVIRSDVAPAVIEAFKKAFVLDPAPDLTNSDYFANEVAQFARYQAMGDALMRSVAHREKGRFDLIERDMKAALSVALHSGSQVYDYWARIKERTQQRQDALAGIAPARGVTTGHHAIDQLLAHKGWGRKELSIILGPPKSGKTATMIDFAKGASLAGKNVLYATLEVAADIIANRADANIAEVLMKELGVKIHDVDSKIKAIAARSGAFVVEEFPSGTLKPSGLRAVIERYKSPQRMPDGTILAPIKFDLVVVDYFDLMAPETYTHEARENSRTIGVDLRALAQEEDLALLTATATNREGIKATVADMTHVAEDINKVRTVDLMISINCTDEEKANGEARLHFTASRNQEDGFTIYIKRDMARMKSIAAVLRVE